jgi:hypothetical protein
MNLKVYFFILGCSILNYSDILYKDFLIKKDEDITFFKISMIMGLYYMILSMELK